jgi:hypothetical protein
VLCVSLLLSNCIVAIAPAPSSMPSLCLARLRKEQFSKRVMLCSYIVSVQRSMYQRVLWLAQIHCLATCSLS